jgi:hypothetical protein
MNAVTEDAVLDVETTEIPPGIRAGIAAAKSLDDIKALPGRVCATLPDHPDVADLIGFRCMNLSGEKLFYEPSREWKDTHYALVPAYTYTTDCDREVELAEALAGDEVPAEDIEKYAEQTAAVHAARDQNARLREDYEDAQVLAAVKAAAAGEPSPLTLTYVRPLTDAEQATGQMAELRRILREVYGVTGWADEKVLRFVDALLDDPRPVIANLHAAFGMEKIDGKRIPSRFRHAFDRFKSSHASLLLCRRPEGTPLGNEAWERHLDWLASPEGWATVQQVVKERAKGDQKRARHALDLLAGVRRGRPLPVAPAPARHVLRGFIPQGKVGTVVSPGGVGKTTLMLDLSVSIAIGEPWLGHHVNTVGDAPTRSEAAQVLFLSLDDSQEDLDAALLDIADHRLPGAYSISGEGADLVAASDLLDEWGANIEARGRLERNLRVVSLQGLVDGPLVNPETGEPTVFAHQLQHYVSLLPRCKFVVLDTLRQFSRADSSDEKVMGGLLRAAGMLTHCPSNPSVIVAHHTTKQGARDRQIDQYAGTGSGTLSDSARFVLYVDKLTPDEVAALPPQVRLEPVFEAFKADTNFRLDRVLVALKQGSKSGHRVSIQQTEEGLQYVESEAPDGTKTRISPVDCPPPALTFLRLISTRGSLRVRTPEPMLIRRWDHDFSRVDAAMPTQEQVAAVKLDAVAQQVLAAVRKIGPASKRDIYAKVGGNFKAVTAAIDQLLAENRLRHSDKKRSGHPLIDCNQTETAD